MLVHPQATLHRVTDGSGPGLALGLGLHADRGIGVHGEHPGRDLRVGPRAPLAVDQEDRPGWEILDPTCCNERAVKCPSGGLAGVDRLDDLGPVLVTLVAEQRDIDRNEHRVIHGPEGTQSGANPSPGTATLYPLSMARLRLFANLREIAGSARVEVGSDTVGGVIEEASERFGPHFRRTVETSRVWVNGETATYDDPVADGDEVVILPPVSGGSRSMTTPTTLDLIAFLPVAVLVVAVVANLQGQEIWAATLVAIAAAWALDIGSVLSSRGRMFAPLAVVVTSAVSAMAAHVMGGTGYSFALVAAVVVALGWAVAFPAYREVDVFSPILLVSLFAGLGTASLVIARSSSSPDPQAVDVFLVAVIAGSVLGSVAERMPSLPLVDPFSMTAIGAVLGAVGPAVLWDLDVVGYLLIGLGIAVALVAGRGVASMLRTGRVALTERPPGWLTSLDGVALAAAIYFPLLAIVL